MDFIQNVLACFSRKMKEINIDWKVVAVDLNRDLIAAQEENKVYVSGMLTWKNF